MLSTGPFQMHKYVCARVYKLYQVYKSNINHPISKNLNIRGVVQLKGRNPYGIHAYET
jgi:hypothetical protein